MIADKLISYECGEMSDAEVIALFSDLIKTGMINGLQGSYQRTAHYLITHGFIDTDGNDTGLMADISQGE
jgi:hypothetical protein